MEETCRQRPPAKATCLVSNLHACAMEARKKLGKLEDTARGVSSVHHAVPGAFAAVASQGFHKLQIRAAMILLLHSVYSA